MNFDAFGVLKNTFDAKIDKLYFTFRDSRNPPEIAIENAQLYFDDQTLGFRIYSLNYPLAPGDSVLVRMKGSIENQGFENWVSDRSILNNGSFIYAMDLVPRIGYQRAYELVDPLKRKKAGLDLREPIPTLDASNLQARSFHYLGNDSDWIQVRSVVSTEKGQTAISSGKLVNQWSAAHRSYFEYVQEVPSVHFTAFLSANYEVIRKVWNGIDLEVYHHPSHDYNIGDFLQAMEKSLVYFTENFGSYDHSYLRVVEFPRLAAYVQAFPGMIPFSERMGFISDLRNGKDINVVFYTTAHETAHQYFAHQIIAANMAGAEFLMESLTQYAALMVMEKEYGKEIIDKILSYERELYLRGRGKATVAEQPLAETVGQNYVHYYKGSIAMYHLKEVIGEAIVNACIKDLLVVYKYKNPPYPISMDFINLLKEKIPENLHVLVDDLFLKVESEFLDI